MCRPRNILRWLSYKRRHICAARLLQIGKLLVYSPTKRVTALEGISHPFFDELRDPTCRLPNGEEGHACQVAVAGAVHGTVASFAKASAAQAVLYTL